MALSQLGNCTGNHQCGVYSLILGWVALAFGLAFGLGGREHASRYLSEMESSLQGAEVSKEKWEQEKAEVKNEVEDVINKAQVDPTNRLKEKASDITDRNRARDTRMRGEGNDDPLVP